MKEFFTILFFGKLILLTPNPVTIDDSFELMLDDSIVAINRGANLQIDVSSMIKVATISETRQAVSSRFPNGCVWAVLHSASGEIALENIGPSVSEDTVRMILFSESGIPVDTDFSRIEIHSCVTMTDVDIYWKNHTK